MPHRDHFDPIFLHRKGWGTKITWGKNFTMGFETKKPFREGFKKKKKILWFFPQNHRGGGSQRHFHKKKIGSQNA